MKKILKYLLIAVILCFVILGSLFFWNKIFNSKINVMIINTNYNKNPISKYHQDEFNIQTSNYLEKNYERYVSYKEKNKSLTDDEIITNVNIGLDYEFYTNIRSSNLEDGILVLCNKYNKLPKNYVPELVTMSTKYSTGGKLHPDAYEAFKNLADDARKIGYTIKISSGYRSYDTQKYTYNNYVARDGIAKADTYSARPGHSEHQTGLAIDVSDGKTRFSNFVNTKEYKWMKENCYKYGWIIRYTKENQNITGYMTEEWHYRYVGKEAAEYIYKNEITFEEYYATFIELN